MSTCFGSLTPINGEIYAEPSLSPNRHLVEVPDRLALARWSRDADVPTIAHCILETLKYEPHTVDTTALRRTLEGVIEHTARGATAKQQETNSQSGDASDRSRHDYHNEENRMKKPEMPQSLADVEADQMTAELLLPILQRRAIEIQRQSGDQMTVAQWLAIRKEAALKIDPETAEVTWIFAWMGDPYGVHPPADWPEREYFARSPGSVVWVHFDDLPETVRDALKWKMPSSDLAFPAGPPLQELADPNRFLVEIPERFTGVCWRRDAEVATIARFILRTLEYEPHADDTSVLRRALEGVLTPQCCGAPSNA